MISNPSLKEASPVSLQITPLEVLSYFESEGFQFFLQAFDEIFSEDMDSLLWLNAVFSERNKNIPTTVQHFSWLIPRCYIYLHVKANLDEDVNVQSISKQEWKTIIQNIHHTQLEELQGLLKERIVAAFVENRYAALGAVLALIQKSDGFAPRRFIDLGCSLNLGIATLYQDTFRPEIIDTYRLWNPSFRDTPPESILGIDVQTPDLLWTSCSYWPQYVLSAYKNLTAKKESISRSAFAVNFLQENITSGEAIIAQTGEGCAEVVHASMVQYFLNEQDRAKVTELAYKLLVLGGVLVETDMFEPGDDFNRPESVVTRVRIKLDKSMSGPFTIIHHSKYRDGTRGPSDSCRVWRPDIAGIADLRKQLHASKDIQ